MRPSLDVTAAELLAAWLEALNELHAEAFRLGAPETDPSGVIALLHVLEERAHERFAAYRDHQLRT